MDNNANDVAKAFADLIAKTLMPDTSRLKALSELKSDIVIDEQNFTWSMPIKPKENGTQAVS